MTPNDSLQAQLEDRLRFETLIADLSSRLINLPASQVHPEIEDAQVSRALDPCPHKSTNPEFLQHPSINPN